MKQYHPSPEEEWIQNEDREELYEKAIKATELLSVLCFQQPEFWQIWRERYILHFSLNKIAKIHNTTVYYVKMKITTADNIVKGLRRQIYRLDKNEK